MELIWSYKLVVAAILFFALLKGEEPERLVATVMIAATGLDIANHALFGEPAFFSINPGHVVIDAWVMIALLWVALRANRGWPMIACAAQIIVMVSHAAKIIDLSLVRYGYFAMTQLPVGIQGLTLLAGTMAHLRRMGRIGRYHAWRLT
jgi:hypothetical protein